MKLVLGDQHVLYLQTVDCGKMMPKEDAIIQPQLSDHGSIFYRIKMNNIFWSYGNAFSVTSLQVYFN